MRNLAVLVVLSSILAACASDPRGHARVWTEGVAANGYSECAKGTTITGGGYTMSDELRATGDVRVASNAPDGNGWRVVCVDAKGHEIKGCRAHALCASVLQP
jgi:hypothetical protein